MNKTVTINLSGILFHIDEDAYNNLKNYLDAIKRSLAKEESKEEIIADIESRIAEIFNEKKQFEDQVISQLEVDAVIAIMGQPEDYKVDEDITDEEPVNQNTSTTVKKLFRDPSDSYIGGISSGLGHYFGIDSVWVRLIWVLLVLGSSGSFLLVYAGFWFFVPKALTTADQLAMKGEPVNISNITRKAKEEFESADIKNKTNYAVERLGEILKVCLKILVKLFGVYLIITATGLLLAAVIGLFGFSFFSLINNFWAEYLNAFVIGFPMWLASLLAFFIIAIPSFFVLLLGLKILFKNIKSVGKITVLSLISVWVISVICAIIFGFTQYTKRSFSGNFSTTENINVPVNDTLKITSLPTDTHYINSYSRFFKIYEQENNGKVMAFDNTQLFIKSTDSDKVVLKCIKKSQGSSHENAKQRAKNITLNYEIKNQTLYIDPVSVAAYSDKFSDQRVELILFVPDNLTLLLDPELSYINSYRSNNGYLNIKGKEGHYLTVKNGIIDCPSCPPKEDWEDESWDSNDNETHGINMDFEDEGDQFNLKIDEHGINIKAKDRSRGKEERFELKIDEDGINMNNI